MSTGLKLSDDKKYVTDYYNLEFPHDYPTIRQPKSFDNEEDEVGGIREDVIIESWRDNIRNVREKYDRRINRFNAIMNSNEPVIALYSGKISEIQLFKDTFKQKYNKTNIWYAVLSDEVVTDQEKQDLLDMENISLCDPEEIIVDENDNMYIDNIAQAGLWFHAINKIHLKISQVNILLLKQLLNGITNFSQRQ